MSDTQPNYNSLIQICAITIISGVILLIFVKKLMNYLNNENQLGSDNVKKRLIDYFTSDPSYDSLEKNNKANIHTSENKEAISNLSSRIENDDNSSKILRFALDYCRASPNISFKNKAITNIGWRSSKYSLFAEFQMINQEGSKINKESILTINNSNKSFINFEDDLNRNTIKNIFFSLDHPNILPYLHLDILPTHHLIVKVQQLNEMGSIKDLLYKTNPTESYCKKYPNNSKGNPLNLSLISLYGRQILNALQYLHKHNWYHLHLHCGNILVTEEKAQIVELENFLLSHTFRNDHCFNYAFDCFINNNSKTDQNSSILTELFKNNFDIFEKLDLIGFGRVLYEMSVGRELKAPFPDESEYKDMDTEVVEVLSMIFKKKTYNYNNITHSLSNMCELPTIGIIDLMNHKLFNYNNTTTNNNNQDTNVQYYDNIRRI